MQRLEDSTVKAVVRGLQQQSGFEFEELKQLFLLFREESLTKFVVLLFLMKKVDRFIYKIKQFINKI